ncbi:aminotransferase class IV [Thermoflexibacter ruber]|uniref:4-amino-4-deoxychorismate lyase n=1 Tax=Thermoflexibacter ruber TaxID=1003 RepID=A0A1I2CAQ0_9BACT|nr:aminotransferase class IV [Thermoflexibacter ruber]SFE65245.1 4-amino-4-deoxychorismate lyase [Thermoflexibacter ruber]
MCLLLETIKVTNKLLQNIDFHNERLNRSRFELLKCKDEIDLAKEVEIPAVLTSEVYKCRVLYSKQIEKIEFQPYLIKPIQALKIIEANEIEYAHKFADRIHLEQLKSGLFPYNDILIVKNHCITDTSYANIVFFDGKNWLTPDTPLLRGTKRSQLLQKQAIQEQRIRLEDLPRFQHAKIINAMIDLEESPIISIDNIVLKA